MKRPVPPHLAAPGYKVSMLAQAAARHVLQLFEVPPGKRPALFGNALMVRHMARTFLISAGHVLNSVSPVERPLFYFASTRRALARLRTRGIAFTQGTAQTDHEDVLDLAACELFSEPPDLDLKEPLESSSIESLGAPDPSDVYLATGFPTSRSKADPSKQRLRTTLSPFLTTLAPPEARASLRADPVLQLVFSLNIRQMDFPDGTVGAIANPAGMSGSPIWLMKNDELQCPGILVEHHRVKKLLVATSIAVGLHLIESAVARFEAPP